ncbi:hypothetical protein PR048_012629 [Dryococelus australis]|uniref:Uncharacterized protein n=1 Tax=Dryococelus australis TaxID=614101 RepID=A0ABQ9HRB7_9NEOP|nr:hypothetical protein PR048_012629 [Dryococelus australis]
MKEAVMKTVVLWSERCLPNYCLDNGIIYFVERSKRKSINVPNKASNLLLKYFHNLTSGGHTGQEKRKRSLNVIFFG